MDVFTLIWDLEDDPGGNVQHVAENGLTVDEVEDVLLDSTGMNAVSSRSSGRPMIFGWTSTGRHIVVVWEVVQEDPRMIRVCTAFDVPEKEAAMIEFRRIHRKSDRTPEELAELKAEHERLSRERPTMDELLESGDYDGPFSQGDVLAFLSALGALKDERERRGLTLSQVAASSGVDEETLSRLESGKLFNPTMFTLWQYARAVGVKLRLTVDTSVVERRRGESLSK